MTVGEGGQPDVHAIGRELLARIRKLGERQEAWGETSPDDPAVRRSLHEAALTVIIRAALVEARPPGPPDIVWIAKAVEERRTTLDVPVDLHLRGVMLALHDVWDEATEIADEMGADPRVISRVGALLLEWATTISTQIMSVYRRLEHENARADERSRSRLLHRVLSGDLQGKVIQDELLLFGISPENMYLAFRARGASGGGGERLERILLDHVAENGGIVAPVGGDLAGIAPSAPPIEDLDAVLGLGPLLGLAGVAGSFRIATKVLEVGQALGLRGVLTLDEVGLDVALASETDVGEHLERKYLKPLVTLGPFGDVLCETLRAFVENRLNVERTARALFVHPNTLRHRLERFEQVTGASLNDMDDVFAVWWTLRRELLRDDAGLS